MKLFVLLFLVGCATASVYDEIDAAAEEVYQEFMLGLEQGGSFKDAVGFDHPLLRRSEDDIKTEIGKRLKETLNEILEKMKESVDNGKRIKEDLQEKLKEIKQKLKDMKIDIGEKARDRMEKLKDRVKEFWENLLEKLKGDKKRSIYDPQAGVFKDMFQKLKDYLKEKIDKEQLKERIERLFGKGSEMADSLLEIINEKGDKYKQKLLDLVDRYLGKDDSKRSIKEVWEKIKEYFKDLHIDLQDKYMKFGEWVKEHFKNIKEKGKDKMENIKKIAQEFIDHTKGVSKDVAKEALEFLRPYKEDLGALWDQVTDTVNDIMKKKD